jgi:hypothetical protein
MTNPREPITRTVTPPPAVTPTAVAATGTEGSPSTPLRLIGKPHGRMRSIGLLLTPTAHHRLHQLAEQTGLTLGEALIDELDRHLANNPAPPSPSGRRTAPRIRRNTPTIPTYILLTPDEAHHLATNAAANHHTVSDYASRLLTTEPQGC